MSDKPVLFDTGFVVRTRGALVALIAAQVSESSLIERHLSGDFGELDADDQEHNRRAIAEGGRVLSRYPLDTYTKVWVITEADRSVTTLLLPSEY
jgi:hypothetical protein